jgi:hypothetical protein
MIGETPQKDGIQVVHLDHDEEKETKVRTLVEFFYWELII